MFGSSSTGLFEVNSDVDLLVTPVAHMRCPQEWLDAASEVERCASRLYSMQPPPLFKEAKTEVSHVCSLCRALVGSTLAHPHVGDL